MLRERNHGRFDCKFERAGPWGTAGSRTGAVKAKNSMTNPLDAKQNAAPAACPSRSPRRSRISRGQSAVEFALISTIALVVMLVGVQFALIGQAALAVSQGCYAEEITGSMRDQGHGRDLAAGGSDLDRVAVVTVDGDQVAVGGQGEAKGTIE